MTAGLIAGKRVPTSSSRHYERWRLPETGEHRRVPWFYSAVVALALKYSHGMSRGTVGLALGERVGSDGGLSASATGGALCCTWVLLVALLG